MSTPHGRAVPLEPAFLLFVGRGMVGFNPSWESRPSGTEKLVSLISANTVVSTPHGRAVPLEPITLTTRPVIMEGFNPSWESRPSGTLEFGRID